MPHLALEHLLYATYSREGTMILRTHPPKVNKSAESLRLTANGDRVTVMRPDHPVAVMDERQWNFDVLRLSPTQERGQFQIIWIELRSAV